MMFRVALECPTMHGKQIKSCYDMNEMSLLHYPSVYVMDKQIFE